jgi:hypothetical protein
MMGSGLFRYLAKQSKVIRVVVFGPNFDISIDRNSSW